ncbi:MAG: amidohydrolase [Proteobacteria bacterium]|nr:amidohydrolase [Pseudomonadota bacterium]
MIRLLALTVLLGGCASAPRGGIPAGGADLVLRNGVFVTMDDDRPRASAVAIDGGRIVAVGHDRDIFPWTGPKSRIVDLRGRAVLPALTDGHAHLSGLGLAMISADLGGCVSADDCARRLLPSLASAPRGGWIQGEGWDQNLFPDKQFPRSGALDRVVSDRPVWLSRIDGHAGWANATALRLAGVTAATRDPEGGRILRDETGAPTGVLVDAAQGLVSRLIPEPSVEDRKAAILRAQERVLKEGLTEVHEMAIDSATVRAYRELEREGRLRLRVYAFLHVDSKAGLDELLSRPPEPAKEDALFRARGVKMFADGALGSRGAALLAPYSDEPSNTGLLTTPPETIERAARKALENGWQLAVHAIGDRGNRVVLDAYAKAGCAAAKDHRFRVEHAQVVTLSDIPRFKELGVLASMQPRHATSDMPWAEARLGPERLKGAYAWRRLLDAGARIVAGSDFPVEPSAPILGLYAALTRQDERGLPEGGWTADQRLRFDEAVRAFTSDAAYGAFEERWRGTAAQGQAADLTVFDRDISEASPAALRESAVDMTIIGGRVVFERNAADPKAN